MQEFTRAFEARRWFDIVELAHMELAEPSIETAFDACVRRGATAVVISPLFFWPGNHWTQDIPNLAAAAAARHPGVRYLVAGPIGTNPLLADLLRSRIEECTSHAAGGPPCSTCKGTDLCRFHIGTIDGTS
jgi:sirohydrochlorin ferrochelatase